MSSPVPSGSMRASLENAVNEYRSQLPGSPGESLLLERGITPETMADFQIGYVRDPISGTSHPRGYLTIPYLTAAGPALMKFKKVQGEGPKALSYEGIKNQPYNVGCLRKEGPIFVCEGEPDTWSAHQCGLNALGVPGVDSWRRLYHRLLRYRDVYVLQQGDVNPLSKDDSRTAAQKLTAEIRMSGVLCRVIEFPNGEDVNSMLQQYGEMYVRKFVGVDEYE